MKNQMKGKKGITLIALVITIIVLLILAGVAIATLTGDNGILTRAGNAKNTANESEIEEKVKLAYQDYYLGQHTKIGYTFKNALDSIFGEGVVSSATEENGIYEIAFIDGKTYNLDTATGTIGLAPEVIKYYDSGDNEIAKTDLTNLDYLIIGGTEKFKVFSKSSNVIKAMPYYNLVIVTSDGTVKQGPADSSSTEIYCCFSSSQYWTNGDDIINMENSNIQQYITKYKTTLEGLGAKGVTVRAATYSELNASGVTGEMRCPNKTNSNSFWIGSANSMDNNVYIISGWDGSFSNGNAIYSNDCVRPIIEIH